MWPRLILAALVAIGSLWLGLSDRSQAQFNGCQAGFCAQPVVAAPGSCTASTNFIARTSGLSGTETTAYQNLICGLVTDGIITGNLSGATGCGTVLDGLYIFATNTTTTANLNLCGTSFGLTTSGTAPTFSADHGYTGGSGCLLTGFSAHTSGGNTTDTSGSFGVYILTNRTTQATVAVFGADDSGSTHTTDLFPYYSSGVSYFVSAVGNNTLTSPSNTAQGLWLASLVSGTTTLYRNGSSVNTASASPTQAPTQNYSILARNDAPSGQACQLPETAQVSAAWFGAGMNSTQAGNMQSRINTFMTALGINVY